MNASPHVPTDHEPEDPATGFPLVDIAQALAGAAITSAPAVAAISRTVRSTVAVVQPAVSGWLRIAARFCRVRFSG